MKVRRIISVLAVFAVMFGTSCSKMAPLEEKGDGGAYCDGVCATGEAKGMMTDDSGTTSITDPDHDEDHDKDNSHEVKED